MKRENWALGQAARKDVFATACDVLFRFLMMYNLWWCMSLIMFSEINLLSCSWHFTVKLGTTLVHCWLVGV